MKRAVAAFRLSALGLAFFVCATPASAFSHTRYLPANNGQWGAWLVSLPGQNGTPIRDAEDLLDTVGGDVVWVGKFDRATNTVRAYWTTGQCCILPLDTWNSDVNACTPSVEPGCAGACTCFDVTVSQGQGFYVKVGPAGGAIVVTGRDDPMTLSLIGPGPGSLTGNQAISLPFYTSLQNAGDLLSDLGGTANVNAIGRLDSQLGTLTLYDGLSGNPFPIVPGEGYDVRLKAGVSLMYVPPSVPPPKVKGRTYKIFGNATTPAFAWELKNGATVVCGNPAEPMVVGGTAVRIAASLAGGVTANCPTNYLSEANGDSLTIYGNPQLDLWIGSATANCLVGFNGCSFNPTIYLVEEVVPAIPAVGLVLLVVSMLGAAY
jgi:hypothetical protein